MPSPAVYVGPDRDERLAAAVTGAGGRVVGADEAEAAVWAGEPGELAGELRPAWRWVQLPSAGVERYVELGVLDRDRDWTSAAGAFGRAVADHALALILAGRRHLAELARARSWTPIEGRTLDGAAIAIVGAGDIGRALIELLTPWDVRITAVTRSGRAVDGADACLPADRIDEVWPEADVVVLAAPATAATRHLVGARELHAMREDALLVNVARGSLVDTDALFDALTAGTIGGAALDVTDPEPLPDGHPLWDAPGVLITPHIANPPGVNEPAFARFVADNVRRFAAGQTLRGLIDVERGY